METINTKRATCPAKRLKRYLREQHQKAARHNYPVKPLEIPRDVSPWEMLRTVIHQYYEREAEQCARIRQAQDLYKNAIAGASESERQA